MRERACLLGRCVMDNRTTVICGVVVADLDTALGKWSYKNLRSSLALTIMKEKDYYRVAFSLTTDKINVMYLGIELVDDSLSADYDSVEQLPKWMQERLAILSMLSYEPPTEIVDGVGRRINKSIYWVEKPDVC